MQWRSPRVVASLACALIIVVFFGGLGVARLTNSSGPTIQWAAPGSGLSPDDQTAIGSQLSAALSASAASDGNAQLFTVTFAQRQGDAAVLSASASSGPGAAPLGHDPLFIIARYQGGHWMVWLPSSPDFCVQLPQMPTQLVTSDDAQLLGCSG
jgi:hypothetical protein